MSTFQIIVLGICAALVLIGVGVFASFGGVLSGTSVGPISIWGTEDSRTISQLLSTMRSQDDDFQNVSYKEIDAATYESELLNAMAAGTGPDLILLAHDELQPFTDKILPIPYGLVSQSSFLNAFIDESQIFLTGGGELALPLMVDPLVMYWNRDMFASAGLAEPPQFWNDFINIAPKITSLDASSNVKKSAVALGQWQNVAHAKAILSTLFMQAGDGIVVRQGGVPEVVFGTSPTNASSNPAESALRFYTEFANPTKTTYSWNRGLPLSTNSFVAGDLAVYFGFASEYSSLAARNPNLKFSVAKVPQIEGSSSRTTFGRLIGMAIPRSSRNPNGAATIAQKLAGADAVATLSELTGLPPVRRDVKINTSSNAAMSVFVESALISRGWIDPRQSESDLIYKTMIESVISGKADTGTAVSEASRALQQLFPR